MDVGCPFVFGPFKNISHVNPVIKQSMEMRAAGGGRKQLTFHLQNLAFSIAQVKAQTNRGKMDGWMNCDISSFSTVYQSYQDDGWVIMKGCVTVQWNPVYD